MLFNSLHFLVFFPIVTLLYFVIPHKLRYLWLLGASYYFYMCWNPKYALLMGTSTLITYLSGLLIDYSNKLEDEKKREFQKKLWVALSFCSNLAILFFFKYFDFAFDNLNRVLAVTGMQLVQPAFDVVLPVGISFYTFQALSYTMDVYRKDIYAEKNIAKYALFVSFFPQLVAGPIERSKNLLVQINEKHSFDYGRTVSGLRLMLIGFFKKIAIADVAAVFVNAVFNDVRSYTGLTLLVAVFLFSIQIYCDFSGYSDIAIGSARIMGFRLMENFKTPYFSFSISEFWSRWHISLSTWFKDYLYIPLGGNRKGFIRKNINLMIVFLVSGLWHGAGWHFIIWGGLHGVYRVAEEIIHLLVKPLEFNFQFLYKVKKFLKICTTFALTCFAWIFFRANSVSDALHIVKNIFSNFSIPQAKANMLSIIASTMFKSKSLAYFYVITLITFIALLLLIDLFKAYKVNNRCASLLFQNRKLPARWFGYWGLSISTIVYFIIQNGIFGQTGSFIYFQF